MQKVVLLGAVGAPGTIVTIDGIAYTVLRVDSSGFLQVSASVLAASSASAAGSVTAPAAAAVIVTSGALAAGNYAVQVLTDYAGTVTAAETFQNMNLRIGAAVVGPVFTTPVALASPTLQTFSLIVPAATAITVNAVAAGGIAAEYKALLIWSLIP